MNTENKWPMSIWDLIKGISHVERQIETIIAHVADMAKRRVELENQLQSMKDGLTLAMENEMLKKVKSQKIHDHCFVDQ